MPTSPLDLAALADLSREFVAPSASGLGYAELVAAVRDVDEVRRRADAAKAVLTAQMSHLSRPELGYSGMAQSLGTHTPVELVQRISGTSAREAKAMIRVGAIVVAATQSSEISEERPDVSPWLHVVGSAVAAGQLSIEAADQIARGLGIPDTVTADELADTAESLVREAAVTPADKLGARARQLRSELDVPRVAEREQDLRDQRFLTLTPQDDGMTRLFGMLDPESAAIVTAAYDAATSPRRGGPRFVDPDAVTRSEELLADTRTLGQIAADTFVELIDMAAKVDPGRVLGTRRPSVQVVVTLADLETGTGMAFIDGQTEAVSVDTARRHLCETGSTALMFGETGEALDLGREARLFTTAQKKAMAVRSGGCIVPGCEKPPSWCEGHHIDEWQRDRGKTNTADGVLLCRHHHMLMHNNGWRVVREGAEYFLMPPASEDPLQRHIPAPSKSQVMRRALIDRGRSLPLRATG